MDSRSGSPSAPRSPEYWLAVLRIAIGVWFAKALLTKVSALGGAWASYEGETRTNYSRLQRLVGIWRCAGALGMAYPLSILIFLTRCFFLLQILIAQFQGNGNWGQSRLSLG